SKWAAGKARGGRISRAIRNRRATQPPAHFHRNPLGRGQLAVFPRCSLLTYRFRYARRSRLEKQPTDRRRKACLFRGQDTRVDVKRHWWRVFFSAFDLDYPARLGLSLRCLMEALDGNGKESQKAGRILYSDNTIPTGGFCNYLILC